MSRKSVFGVNRDVHFAATVSSIDDAKTWMEASEIRMSDMNAETPQPFTVMMSLEISPFSVFSTNRIPCTSVISVNKDEIHFVN